MKPAIPCNGPEVAALLTRALDPALEFVDGGTTLGSVHGMATWVRRQFADDVERQTLCLATDNRALIAAALLSSLAGGPIVLLPYSFSAQALSGLHQATGCRRALVDPEQSPPPGMEPIRPPGEGGGTVASLPAIHLDEELLRLYTGGTTGAPQLWSKTGTNLFGEALFLAAHFAVSSSDRIVATISPAHIYGLLYSVLLPLVSGASVVPGIPSFPEEIVRCVREREATVLVSVPPHYRVLRGKGCLGDSLRLAFSSAGMLNVTDNNAFSLANRCGIVEIYGSTETGGIALRNRSRGESGFTPYSTIDWQIHNQRLRIRTPYLSPSLPLDAAGGYLANDWVEADGTTAFQLRGRTDSVIKVGGKRVDLEEVKAAIKDMLGVTDCLVLALPDRGSREHRIVALVEGQFVEIEEFRTLLMTRFEPYALPGAIKTIDRLPVTDNGKVDREAVLKLFTP